jgi:glycosyltransferase involved in cell wall biosynthesis
MELQTNREFPISIISPNKQAFSESFIKAHRDLLPFKIHYYHGGKIPTYCNEKNLKAGSFYKKAFQFLISKISSNEKWHIYNLKKSLRKNKTKVILCEYGTTGAEMWKICKQLNIPLIVHFHGFDASAINVIEHYSKAYTQMFEYSSAVISVSKVMSEKLLAMGCSGEKIVLNTYGPHDDFFTVDPTYESNSLISLGRFVDKKAPYYTILAFHKALAKFPDMQLIMGGEGPLLNSCKNLARFLGIEAKVDFPGVLNRPEFIDYLRQARAYIQHSITADNGDMEGTPVAILEASAAGLPVVSTRHAGIPCVIKDGETGLLVEEHDVNGMAEEILKVMVDRNYSVKLGAAGKEFIRNNFSMSKHINLLTDVIKKAAAG